MSDSTFLLKCVIVLALLFILVAALYPGEEGPWDDFTTALSDAPVFPTFGFTASEASLTLIPVANGTNPPTTAFAEFGSGSGCSTAQWWGCIATQDSGDSYASNSGINEAQSAFSVKLPTFGVGDFHILNVTVEFQCYGNSGTPVRANFGFNATNDTSQFGTAFMPGGEFCLIGTTNGWQNKTAYFIFDIPPLEIPGQLVSLFSGSEMLISNEDSVDLFFSFTKITVVYLIEHFSADVVCGGFDVGCVLNQFFTWVADFALFLVSILIFVAEFFMFVLGVLYAITIGFVATFTFFFSLPGAPAEAQAIISALFLGIVAFMSFILIKVVRGTGSI